MKPPKLQNFFGATVIVALTATSAFADGINIKTGVSHQDLVEAGLADPLVQPPAGAEEVAPGFFTGYDNIVFKDCRYKLTRVRAEEGYQIRVTPIDCCDHITRAERDFLGEWVAEKYGYPTTVLNVPCDDNGEPDIPKDLVQPARGTCIGSCDRDRDRDQNRSFSRDTGTGAPSGGGNAPPGADFN